jgi:glyoxylase-like metal-dependent hydrolase (beta-lactamase superfamily II)
MSQKIMQLAPDVHGVCTVMVNVYYWGRPGQNSKWVLVDAGMPGSSGKVLRTAKELFGDAPPAAVILTHGHFDHVGALPAILSRWNRTPIYCHPQELPFVTGKADYPRPDPSVGGGMMARLSPLFPRHRYDFSPNVHPLPPDGRVPDMPEWEWYHTPGHAPGHVSLFRARDRLLLAGDAIVAVRQESAIAVMNQQPQEVRPPPAYFTIDWTAAYESIERLRSLEPAVAGTGHGWPLRGQKLKRGLQELEERFEQVGLPKRGRYVSQTWRKPVRVGSRSAGY